MEGGRPGNRTVHDILLDFSDEQRIPFPQALLGAEYDDTFGLFNNQRRCSTPVSKEIPRQYIESTEDENGNALNSVFDNDDIFNLSNVSEFSCNGDEEFQDEWYTRFSEINSDRIKLFKDLVLVELEPLPHPATENHHQASVESKSQALGEPQPQGLKERRPKATVETQPAPPSNGKAIREARNHHNISADEIKLPQRQNSFKRSNITNVKSSGYGQQPVSRMPPPSPKYIPSPVRSRARSSFTQSSPLREPIRRPMTLATPPRTGKPDLNSTFTRSNTLPRANSTSVIRSTTSAALPSDKNEKLDLKVKGSTLNQAPNKASGLPMPQYGPMKKGDVTKVLNKYGFKK